MVSTETNSSERTLALEGPDSAGDTAGVKKPAVFRNCRLGMVGRADAARLVRAS